MKYLTSLNSITTNPKAPCLNLNQNVWSLILTSKAAISSQHLKYRKMSMTSSWVMMLILLVIINGFTFLCKEWLLIRSTLSMLLISLKMILYSTMVWLLLCTPWLKTREFLAMIGVGGDRVKKSLTRKVA